MSLRWRVGALGVVACLATVVLGLVVSSAVGDSNRAVTNLGMRWSPATATANALLAHLVDQETGERGFVITGQRSYLQPYDAGQRAAAHDLATLHTLLATDPVAVERMAAIEQDSTVWRVQAAQPEIATRTGGASAGTVRVTADRGKTLFDQVRRDVAGLQQLIEQRREAAQREVGSANDRLVDWLWASIVTAVALGVVILAGIVWWLLRPIQRLSAAMLRVSAGDIAAPVHVTGPPEIERLSANADDMRRRILTELERSEAARQALEQRGPVVVGLSQQLAPRATVPIPGLRYAATLRPAEGLLAGDWVDVLPLGHDRVALMLLDVSGHGAAAGIEAMRLKTVITTALAFGRQPHEALAQAAAGFTEDERFATAIVVVVDTVSGYLRWANAGHLAPRVVPLDAKSVEPDDLEMLRTTGPMLSALTSGWTTRTWRLEVGQMLLAFSDGLTEARDRTGREFGIDGVCAALSQTTVRDVDTAVSVCLAAVRAHSADVHRDDITVLAVTRDPSTVVPTRAAAPDELPQRQI